MCKERLADAQKQLGGLRQAVSDLKARVPKAKGTNGPGAYSMTHAPNWRIDEDTQKSQKQVDAIVNDIVRSILVGSDEELLTGQAIYDGVLRHPRLLALREEQKDGKAEEKRQMENEMIIGRLASAITTLKRGCHTLHQWHAYQSILTAIAPDLGEDHGRDNAMLKRRFKIYADVAEKAMLRRQAIDDEKADPSEPWFNEKKAEYSNKLSKMHPTAFQKAQQVWEDETQCSANTDDVVKNCDRAPGNHPAACAQELRASNGQLDGPSQGGRPPRPRLCKAAPRGRGNPCAHGGEGRQQD